MDHSMDDEIKKKYEEWVKDVEDGFSYALEGEYGRRLCFEVGFKLGHRSETYKDE